MQRSPPLTGDDSRRGNRRSVTRDERQSLQQIIRNLARVITALKEGVRRCRITPHSTADDVAVSRPSRPTISCARISRSFFRVPQVPERTCKRRYVYVPSPAKTGRDASTPETSDWLWVVIRRRRRSARRMAEAGSQPCLHPQLRTLLKPATYS